MSKASRGRIVAPILFVAGLSLIAFVGDDLLTLLFGRTAPSTIVAIDQPRRNRTLTVEAREQGVPPARYRIYIPREATGYSVGQSLDVRLGFSETALRDHPDAWNRPRGMVGIGLVLLLPGAWAFYRRAKKRKA